MEDPITSIVLALFLLGLSIFQYQAARSSNLKRLQRFDRRLEARFAGQFFSDKDKTQTELTRRMVYFFGGKLVPKRGETIAISLRATPISSTIYEWTVTATRSLQEENETSGALVFDHESKQFFVSTRHDLGASISMIYGERSEAFMRLEGAAREALKSLTSAATCRIEVTEHEVRFRGDLPIPTALDIIEEMLALALDWFDVEPPAASTQRGALWEAARHPPHALVEVASWVALWCNGDDEEQLREVVRRPDATHPMLCAVLLVYGDEEASENAAEVFRPGALPTLDIQLPALRIAALGALIAVNLKGSKEKAEMLRRILCDLPEERRSEIVRQWGGESASTLTRLVSQICGTQERDMPPLFSLSLSQPPSYVESALLGLADICLRWLEIEQDWHRAKDLGEAVAATDVAASVLEHWFDTPDALLDTPHGVTALAATLIDCTRGTALQRKWVEWLTRHRAREGVLAALCEIFLYAHVWKLHMLASAPLYEEEAATVSGLVRMHIERRGPLPEGRAQALSALFERLGEEVGQYGQMTLSSEETTRGGLSEAKASTGDLTRTDS